MLLLKFCAKCHLDSTNLIFLAICSVCAGGEGRIQNPTLSSRLPFCVRCCEEKYRRQNSCDKGLRTVQCSVGNTMEKMRHHAGM